MYQVVKSIFWEVLVLSKLSFLSNKNKSGASDSKKGTLWTTPWSWKDSEGCYVGYNKEVWLYRQLNPQPIEWEDPSTRLARGQVLHTILSELGGTSKDLVGGMTTFAQKRELHLIAITHDTLFSADVTAPDRLRDYIEASLDFPIPRKIVLIGVKLRSNSSAALGKARGVKGILRAASEMATGILGEGVPDLSAFDADRDKVSEILKRNSANIPSKEALNQLESWYNHGKGPDVEVIDTRDVLYVDGGKERIEMAALMEFSEPSFTSPESLWVYDSFTNNDGPSVVSIRGELEPSTVARARARRSQRKIKSQLEEEAATQDLEREETSTTLRLAEEVESFFVSAKEPLISNTSIIFARRVKESDETYIDELRKVYGIKVKSLEHRQIASLDETLPCSDKRVNPFLQDVNPAMLAYSGLNSFSNIGDGKGVFLGLANPDYTAVFLDPLGAPAANLPPAMAIFGDPGSGKTFTAQHLAAQCTFLGLRVFFINPKAFDGGLGSMAEMVGGEVVRMSELEGLRGVFDPFRFAPTPVMAAEIATGFILSVLGTRGSGVGFTQAQELSLGSGLKKGAQAGARSVGAALEYVTDPLVIEQVQQLAETSSMFALGIGTGKTSEIPTGTGLTLIEFDRKLPLPERGTSARDYSTEQRVALAAIRLTTRMCLETLVKAGGGAFFLDEAWTFLNSSEGLSTIQQMGREGRSMNILPVFITQRVSDLVREGVDMESYLSRVLVMKLSDKKDAIAALTLCGLEPTESRIAWLKEAGPRKDGESVTPAQGLLRDLENRHSAVLLGPVPDLASDAFTTNPLERAKREALQKADLVEPIVNNVSNFDAEEGLEEAKSFERVVDSGQRVTEAVNDIDAKPVDVPAGWVKPILPE